MAFWKLSCKKVSEPQLYRLSVCSWRRRVIEAGSSGTARQLPRKSDCRLWHCPSDSGSDWRFLHIDRSSEVNAGRLWPSVGGRRVRQEHERMLSSSRLSRLPTASGTVASPLQP